MDCGEYIMDEDYFIRGHLRSCRACRDPGATPRVMPSIEEEPDASTESTPEPNAGAAEAARGAHSGPTIVNSTVHGNVFVIHHYNTPPPSAGGGAR